MPLSSTNVNRRGSKPRRVWRQRARNRSTRGVARSLACRDFFSAADPSAAAPGTPWPHSPSDGLRVRPRWHRGVAGRAFPGEWGRAKTADRAGTLPPAVTGVAPAPQNLLYPTQADTKLIGSIVLGITVGFPGFDQLAAQIVGVPHAT